MSRAAAERQRTEPKTCLRVVRWFEPDSMTERWQATPLDAVPIADIRWLDLDAFADVKIVAAGRHVDRSLGAWSADCPGEQMIEIRFHHPTPVSRVRVVSSEFEQSRTQEITLWASLHRGQQHREVLRHQFSFSPNGATEEVGEYALGLDGVSVIQLRIVPSIDGQPAVARVTEFRVASD
jgi:hypothetical protein